MARSAAREEFLLDPGIVFLNHGSFGARPKSVLAAQEASRRECEQAPVAFLSRRSGALMEGALAALGAFVGAAPADLAFVQNATTGVSVAAASSGLRPGDEVLGTDHEYGACALAWKRACARAGASWRELSLPFPWDESGGDEEFMSRLEAALTPRTRVLFLSHITSASALRLPVERAVALADARGILTVIDGAHAPAQVDLDLDSLGADLYIANCHKWLCAPLGSAFIHVRRGSQAALDPLVTSWGLVAEAEGSAAHDAYAGTGLLARRLQWLGTRDLSPFLAVPSAIDWCRKHSGPEEGLRCSRLAAWTAGEGARILGLQPAIQHGSGLRMALLPLPSCDAAEVKRELYDRFLIEIPVTTVSGRNWLRLSIQVYNDESDARRLLDALPRLASLSGPGNQ